MLQKRPPVVVVMGSVDHGKTTLLDYIRKSNVAAKEAGGITQSVGAYEIWHTKSASPPNGSENTNAPTRIEKIGECLTFIDTPGHEAFSKMRQRGTMAADVAILVVAADDSVQPQTKEAIQIAQNAKIPYVVAINKIDKQPNYEKVKNDLMRANVMLEGFGGDISYQPISAKTGQGVNELLDLVLLAADVADLKYDPDVPAEGFILESKIDGRHGIIATTIIKNGTLKIGDLIATGHTGGKVRGLQNFLGEKIKSATACAPVLISGFDALPKVGEMFFVGRKAEEKTATKKPATAASAIKEEGALALIIKGDVTGSAEALAEIVKNLPAEGKTIKIIEESVGDITDGDVKLAISTGATIIGFRVRKTKPAETLARDNKITVLTSEIIYELVKAIEEELLSDKKKYSGILEILAVFSKKNNKQTIGGKVTEGEIKKHSNLIIQRGGAEIGHGKIINLQQMKKDATRVEAGKECGLIFDSEVEIKVGDVLSAQ